MNTGTVWRSYLYAPGNNAKLLQRVFTAGADAVVLDLEDAVPGPEKERARQMVAAALRERAGHARPAALVRVNGAQTGLCEGDIQAVVGPGLRGIRLPKAESAVAVHTVAAWIEAAEQRAGLEAGTVRLECLIESAAAVFGAYEIASAHPRVAALGFGQADFVSDVGARPTRDGWESYHARAQLVLASRVAGIAPPVDSVYLRLDDDDGLLASARSARTLGFFGKAAVHPRQLAAIHAAFTPTAEEIAEARRILAAFAGAAATGAGATRAAQIGLIDRPVAARARNVLALAEMLDAPG